MDNKTARGKILKIYAVILTVGGIYALWLAVTGLKIPCLYKMIFGIECPGCGLTRMFLSMLRLDFVRAFYWNPAFFVLFFVWNVISFFYFVGSPKFIRKSRFLYAAILVSVLFIMTIYFLRILF